MKTSSTDTRDIEAALAQAYAICYNESDGVEEASLTKVNDIVKGAAALRRMAGAAEDIGFLALPLDQYLERLARTADVEIEDVLFDVQRDDSAARLHSCIALADRLQLLTQYVRIWVRAWFAVEFQATQRPAFVMARGSAQLAASTPETSSRLDEAAPPELVDAELLRLESRYAASYYEELQRTLRMLM